MSLGDFDHFFLRFGVRMQVLLLSPFLNPLKSVLTYYMIKAVAQFGATSMKKKEFSSRLPSVRMQTIQQC